MKGQNSVKEDKKNLSNHFINKIRDRRNMMTNNDF